MLLRDKVLAQLLEVYCLTPSSSSSDQKQQPPQHFVNQGVDSCLEALVLSNDLRFLTQSVVPLLRVEQPPRLQALLKVITIRIKAAAATTMQLTRDDLEGLLEQSQFYAEVINHANADVRKCCVFCLVELHSIIA